MPKLRILSSTEVVKILENEGFTVASQRGSHIKLIRITTAGRQILTIPENKQLPTGTLKAIYNQITRFISQEELHRYFYHE